MIVLVDMDGVLADIEHRLESQLRERFDMPTIPVVDRRGFWIDTHYAEKFPDDAAAYKARIDLILNAKGFFAGMQPIEGALEGMERLRSVGHTVKLCTAPLIDNPYCAFEKFAWVEGHMGESWMRSIIIAKDKTYIRGNVLIDDKAEITGDLKPEWRHLLYDCQTNTELRHAHTGGLFSWADKHHWLFT